MSILSNASLDIHLAAFMFACVLVFTLIFEDITQRIESALGEQVVFLQMLSKVYREMMILGFISLSVVLINDFELIHDHNALIHFEFAHLLAFFWAMVYVLNSMISVFRLRMTRKDWSVCAHLKTETICTVVEERMKKDAGVSDKLRPDQLAKKFLNGTNGDSWRPFWWSLFPWVFDGWEHLVREPRLILPVMTLAVADNHTHTFYPPTGVVEDPAAHLSARL